MKVVNIAIYCFKSFPVRSFHSQFLKKGVSSYSLFFKNYAVNNHPPISEKEINMLLHLIREIKPDVVTMSILAPYVIISKRIIHEVRKMFDVPIIVGGKYPTIEPEKALTFADYACQGEGEHVLDEIISRFRSEKDFKGIKGLWYKGNNGKAVNMGQQRLIQNLDDLPFQSVGEPNMYFIENNMLSKEDPELTDPFLLIMTSRGCFYQCAFCINSVLVPMNKGNGRFVRQRCPENVIEEIELRLQKHKSRVERLYFIDELFGFNKEWVEVFCKMYKEKIGIPFACELNPKLIKEKNIKLLADAGLFELDFGIQSGSDEIRNVIMNRPGTNSEMLEKIAILRKYNITPRYDLILDNPFDTVEVLEETIALIWKLPKPLYFNVYKLQYFPGQTLTMQALKRGFINEDDLTEEKMADSCLKSWTFVPKLFTRSRKEYLQNCIYCLVWNLKFSAFLSKKLLEKPNLFWIITTNIIAAISYSFSVRKSLKRLRIGFKLLLRGNFKQLALKVILMIKKKKKEFVETRGLT